MLKWREEIECIELVIFRDDIQFYTVVPCHENLKDTLDSKEFKNYPLTLRLNPGVKSASKLHLICGFPLSLPLLAVLDIPLPEWLLRNQQIPLCLSDAKF